MKHVLTVVIGLVILFTSHSVEAQDRWSSETHSGVAFAAQEPGDADLGTGAGADVDVEETGYVFGLQFVHPLGASSLAYFRWPLFNSMLKGVL